MSSPMQRSLALYRERGWKPWIVERWIPHAKIRIDFFGLGDFIALKPGETPHVVQTTDATSFSKHRDKMLEAEHLTLVLEHFRVVLHGWGKQKVKRGGKAVQYVLREAEFTMKDVPVQTLEEAFG